MAIKFTALGGAGEVGRSSFIIDAGEKVLLDSGVKLTPKGVEYPLDVKVNLDAIIVSHAHLDHSGHLPHLFKKSNSITYMTPPTLDLSRMLWHDTLKIADLEDLPEPFSKDEIKRAERYTFPLNFEKPMSISERATVELFDAGHILGAAMVKLDFGKKTVLYSGDFKIEEMRLHKGASMKFGKVDYAIIETTYGNREHGKRKEIEKKFVEDVQDTIDKGGHALIAAFAVGRSQEIMDVLYEYNLNADIYLEGMCQKASEIYLSYPNYLKNYQFLKKAMRRVRFVKSVNTRRMALKKPSVIITTAGMLQGGPITTYLPLLYNDANSKLFMTGYQVAETPGRVLLDTGKLNLNGVWVKPKMQYEKYDFSAHASRSELIEALEKMNPDKVICVHGDPEITDVFNSEMRAKGFNMISPERGKEITLD